MALPQRASRALHIDGRTFRWLSSPHHRFETNADGQPVHQILDFVDLYAGLDAPGAGELRARFPVSVLTEWGWRGGPPESAIPAPLAERAIRWALLSGWSPEGEDFVLPPAHLRFLRTPRPLLYTAPLIVRISITETEPLGPARVRLTGTVIQTFRGTPAATLTFTAALPPAQVPPQAMAFLEHTADGLAAMPRYGGVLRILDDRVLIIDGSAEERWLLHPLHEIVRELLSMSEE